MPQICFREESSADRICSRSRCSPSPAVMANPNSGIPIKAEQDSDGSAQSTADMTAFVQNLLMQMQTRFQAMSENIISKIDEMGMRIDELEQSINDLKAEMGSDSMTTPSKTKDEGSKPADSSA
ncbi:hypothetical protein SEVIR_4G195900v4 [Setaria viridis]|uniref:Uncharacterized protein n=1 Tax=Setaria viridis TaxID=4556 RepID=A0A4U6UWC4_SETVI|nr:heat shock factor-binding protein isoform X1 [Setaria viridis]TKW20930.1 hypothetical protein SEVIR_4G195900v2 [Setaria viridis]